MKVLLFLQKQQENALLKIEVLLFNLMSSTFLLAMGNVITGKGQENVFLTTMYNLQWHMEERE
jgi:hypothetical protein